MSQKGGKRVECLCYPRYEQHYCLHWFHYFDSPFPSPIGQCNISSMSLLPMPHQPQTSTSNNIFRRDLDSQIIRRHHKSTSGSGLSTLQTIKDKIRDLQRCIQVKSYLEIFVQLQPSFFNEFWADIAEWLLTGQLQSRNPSALHGKIQWWQNNE